MEKMRTRMLPSMTNGEVEKYLQRSDIIIIPVGHCETLGMYPVDAEYVGAEAYARLIAEQVDGLVLPGLHFFHVGATQVGKATIHMSMMNGFKYLTAIAQSLLQQGFRRQVYIPGHQPVSQFLLPFITQFFDENKVPLFYLDVNAHMRANGILPEMVYDPSKRPQPKKISDDERMGDFAKTIGAYKICGRLQDFPTGAEVNCERYVRGAYQETEGDFALHELMKSRPTLLSCSPAFYYSDVSQHGTNFLPETREEIDREGEIGEKYLRGLIDKCDFVSIMDNLKKVDIYQNTVIMEKHGDHLPRNKWTPNSVKQF